MSTPTPTWNLGTVALNGRDGDTIRDTGAKYNAHRHFSTDIENAIQGAAAPTAANPFATIADISGGSSGSGVTILHTTVPLTYGARAILDHDAIPMDQSYRFFFTSMVKRRGDVNGERYSWGTGTPVNLMTAGTNLIVSGSGTAYRFDRAQGAGVRANTLVKIQKNETQTVSYSIYGTYGGGDEAGELTFSYFSLGDGTYPVISITADNGAGSLNYGNGYPSGYWFQWITEQEHPVLDDGVFKRGPVIYNSYLSDTTCRFKFSFDGGTTWKYWNGTAWTTTDLSQENWDAQSCKVSSSTISNDYSNRFYDCKAIIDSNGNEIPTNAWTSIQSSVPIKVALAVNPPDINTQQWIGGLQWVYTDPDSWEQTPYITASRISTTRIRFECTNSLSSSSYTDGIGTVLIAANQE